MQITDEMVAEACVSWWRHAGVHNADKAVMRAALEPPK